MSDTGDPRAPKTRMIGKDIVQGLQQYLGGYMDTMLPQLRQGESAALGTRQAIAPQEQSLRAQLYSKYAPQYARTQAQLAKIASRGELDVARGPGGKTVQEVAGLQEKIDPQAEATRRMTLAKLQELMGPMSTGEIEAIARGQNRLNIASGLDIPSNTGTVASALQFGEAARNRLERGAGLAASAYPGLQRADLGSIYGMATGRGRNINQNMGVTDTTLTGPGIDLAEGFANALAAGKLKGMDIDANRRTMHDFMAMGVSSAGSIIPG